MKKIREAVEHVKRNKISTGIIMSALVLTIFFVFKEHGIKWLIIMFATGSIMEVWINLKNNEQRIYITIIAVIIISIPMYFSYLMLELFGRWFFLFLAINNYATDTGAYLFGKYAKNKNWQLKRLAPKISPTKTWEAAFAGLILSLILCLIFKNLLLYPSFITVDCFTVFILIIIGSIGNISGDLCASAFKRFINVKDFSGIFGSHGGFLDKLDGFIFCAFNYTLFFAFIFFKNSLIPINLNLF